MASPAQHTEGDEQANSVYSVEEDEKDEVDHFSKMKPHFIRTPSVLNTIIEQIHPEILAKSHQSNFVIFPPKLEGCTVVDLGCGVGRDVFILSKLVGENGQVIGIDSDANQLHVAREHIDYHLQKFGLKKSNIEFVNGDIDQLEKTLLKENSIDVVVSNSVVNYKRNKQSIIDGVCKALKPGGEFYFSDVYVNRPIPPEYQDLLSGEYIGGALRWEDLILYATGAGFTQPRLVTAKPITIENEDVEKAIGKSKFVSAIFRCFKLPSNEQETRAFTLPYQLTYETPVPHSEEEFFFDHSLQFRLGELLVVDDPSIALALSLSRYRDNFTFDPVTDENAEAVTIVETVEEVPLSSSNDVIQKRTTTTTVTTFPLED